MTIELWFHDSNKDMRLENVKSVNITGPGTAEVTCWGNDAITHRGLRRISMPEPFVFPEPRMEKIGIWMNTKGELIQTETDSRANARGEVGDLLVYECSVNDHREFERGKIVGRMRPSTFKEIYPDYSMVEL